MVRRYKCVVNYDGTQFSGSQVQPNARTVQGEIERVLMKVHKNKHIRIHASGRTDAGVHAKGQVFHFDTHLELAEEQWKRALNALLPQDIYIHQVKHVADDFHSRFDAIEKEYRYFILNSKEQNVFKRHFTYYHPQALDFALMEQACQFFKGTHDFTSFCSHRSNIKGSKVRTLYDVRCVKKDDEIHIIFRGNGFLYNMVRIIVGTLLDVGLKKTSLSDINKIIQQKDRTKAGKTAPPEGLFLWEVIYES